MSAVKTSAFSYAHLAGAVAQLTTKQKKDEFFKLAMMKIYLIVHHAVYNQRRDFMQHLSGAAAQLRWFYIRGLTYTEEVEKAMGTLDDPREEDIKRAVTTAPFVRHLRGRGWLVAYYTTPPLDTIHVRTCGMFQEDIIRMRLSSGVWTHYCVNILDSQGEGKSEIDNIELRALVRDLGWGD